MPADLGVLSELVLLALTGLTVTVAHSTLDISPVVASFTEEILAIVDHSGSIGASGSTVEPFRTIDQDDVPVAKQGRLSPQEPRPLATFVVRRTRGGRVRPNLETKQVTKASTRPITGQSSSLVVAEETKSKSGGINIFFLEEKVPPSRLLTRFSYLRAGYQDR